MAMPEKAQHREIHNQRPNKIANARPDYYQHSHSNLFIGSQVLFIGQLLA